MPEKWTPPFPAEYPKCAERRFRPVASTSPSYRVVAPSRQPRYPVRRPPFFESDLPRFNTAAEKKFSLAASRLQEEFHIFSDCFDAEGDAVDSPQGKARPLSPEIATEWRNRRAG